MIVFNCQLYNEKKSSLVRFFLARLLLPFQLGLKQKTKSENFLISQPFPGERNCSNEVNTT